MRNFLPLFFLAAVFSANVAEAGLVGGIDPSDIQRTSEVFTTLTPQGGGVIEYNYNVVNTSPAPQIVGGGVNGQFRENDFFEFLEVYPLIVNYEVPLPATQATTVFGIQAPAGWGHEILSDTDYTSTFGVPNPFGAPFILHYFSLAAFGQIPVTVEANSIAPINFSANNPILAPLVHENSLDGFILQSTLSPIDGPYLTSWLDEFRNIGDPPLPFGSVGGGGTIPFSSPTTIPEPATMLMMGLGTLGLGLAKRFKR